MEEHDALQALSALAQAQRLRIFRALVVAGPDGLTPGVLADALALAPSALSFHLKELVRSALATVEPQGRHLVYRADIAVMNGLMDYLTEHCCEGADCGVAATAPASACAPATPRRKR